MNQTKQHHIGKVGEEFAVQYLLQQGYQVLELNWVCAWGEIDVVATENDRLHLIEVKTRRARTTDEALVNISDRKKQRMLKSAYAYLHQHQQEDCAWQIDIIAIALQPNHLPSLEHIEDALGW